ncbi:hypothetical protein [Plantibacter flavus]|nr:hypothetical protein [Plantibacter flavus]
MALLRASDGRLAGFAASTPELLGAFLRRDVSWVELAGSELLALPILPRMLVLEPGSPRQLVVDLRAAGVPPIASAGAAGGARIVAVDTKANGSLSGTLVSRGVDIASDPPSIVDDDTLEVEEPSPARAWRV